MISSLSAFGLCLGALTPLKVGNGLNRDFKELSNWCFSHSRHHLGITKVGTWPSRKHWGQEYKIAI